MVEANVHLLCIRETVGVIINVSIPSSSGLNLLYLDRIIDPIVIIITWDDEICSPLEDISIVSGDSGDNACKVTAWVHTDGEAAPSASEVMAPISSLPRLHTTS